MVKGEKTAEMFFFFIYRKEGNTHIHAQRPTYTKPKLSPGASHFGESQLQSEGHSAPAHTSMTTIQISELQGKKNKKHKTEHKLNFLPSLADNRCTSKNTHFRYLRPYTPLYQMLYRGKNRERERANNMSIINMLPL